jgi:hypothetical protein
MRNKPVICECACGGEITPPDTRFVSVEFEGLPVEVIFAHACGAEGHAQLEWDEYAELSEAWVSWVEDAREERQMQRTVFSPEWIGRRVKAFRDALDQVETLEDVIPLWMKQRGHAPETIPKERI